jgi:hypothetical protein
VEQRGAHLLHLRLHAVRAPQDAHGADWYLGRRSASVTREVSGSGLRGARSFIGEEALARRR